MFYNARWYDPALGRFAQADSIVPPGVQGLDRYAYVNNNPMRYTDPTGHMCSDPDNTQKNAHCEGSAHVKTKVGNKVVAGNGEFGGGNRRSGILSTPYGGPCISVVCLPTPEPQLTFPMFPPDIPALPLFPDDGGEHIVSPPHGYELRDKTYFDYDRVDWINATVDVANIVTTGAIMTCPEIYVTCGLVGPSEAVSVVGSVYSFASAKNNGDFGNAVFSTLLDQSGLVRAIPIIGIEYSINDLIFSINEGFYDMPTWQPIGSR